MDFLGAVYCAVRNTVKSSFSVKEKSFEDFYCRDGDPNPAHQHKLNHDTRNRHPGGKITPEQFEICENYETNVIFREHQCPTGADGEYIPYSANW